MKIDRHLLASLFLLSAAFAQAQLKFDKLTCEYAENVISVDVQRPQFSWTFISIGRNQRQSAYEIVVSEQGDDNSKPSWVSGKVSSSKSTNIEYGGTPLQPFKKYYWRVRVYDDGDKPSAWSKSASFETAMLNQGDSKAKWIGDGSKQFVRDEEFYADDRMPLFRKVISAQKEIKSARLYISGLGYYEAYLNGKKIGDHVLDPGWTAYQKQVLYSVYDITSQLKRGNNVAGVM